MAGESKLQDYKITFVPNDAKARVDLVKNLVAMANAGGGQIIYGRDETETPGVDDATCTALDSARLDDFVRKYIIPAPMEISHDIQVLDNGRFVLTLTVAAAQYPIVMARKGDWKGMDSRKDSSIFLKGDIWTRHSSKTERVHFEDLRQWVERAKQDERERILSRITHLANLPEGTEIQIVPSGQQPIDSPERLLEYAAMRHQYDPSHLLTSSDLVHLFINRNALGSFNETQLRLLISSALRRPPTLFWWIIKVDDNPQLILEEIEKCPDASDRDKSDAARSIIEMATIFAEDEMLDKILAKLQRSRYKHFRDEAEAWQGRAALLVQLKERIFNARHNDRSLMNFTIDELERLATELAILWGDQSKKASISRKLGDVTRVVWSNNSRFAHVLMDK